MELAIPLAMQARDWDCLGKARAELGTSWLFIGDYSNAIEYFQAYLLDFHRYDTATKYLGPVHFNLALSFRRRKDNQRAVDHYRKSLEWYSERGFTVMSGKIHQNLAWLHCLDGDVEAAQDEIRLADTFAEVCGAEFKTEQLLCRAFVHMLQKELICALTLTAEILQSKRPGTTDSHKANSCWIAGRCALALYNLKTAQEFAEYAIEYALRAKDTAAISAANTLKADVARRKQGSDEAAG